MRSKVVNIDLNKLDMDIDVFKAIHKMENVYLIMSKDTRDTIGTENYRQLYGKNNSFNCLAMYNGNKVMIDDSVPFGEVDIR